MGEQIKRDQIVLAAFGGGFTWGSFLKMGILKPKKKVKIYINRIIINLAKHLSNITTL